MKNRVWLMVTLYLLGGVVWVPESWANEKSEQEIAAELAQIQEDESKIQMYIKEGADKALFAENIQALKQKKQQLQSLLKAKEKEASHQAVARKKSVRRELSGNMQLKDRHSQPAAKSAEKVVAPRHALESAEKKETSSPASTPASGPAPAPVAAEAPPAASQPFKIGMMFDAYLSWWSTPQQPGAPEPFRFYDINHEDFTVNLMELNVSGTRDKFSYRFDFDFGDFAEQNTTDDISKHIGQANVTYDFGLEKPVTLTFGKFYTHIGYELAKAQENWNYSRALAFSFGGPFWHEGIALNGELPSGLVFGAYLYDRWDGRLDQNNGKTLGWRLGYKNDRFSIYYNAITGPEQTSKNDRKKTVHEVNASYTVNDQLSLAADGLVGSDRLAIADTDDSKWWAVVGYANYKVSDWYKFCPRVEHFRDEAGGIFGAATWVNAISLDHSFRVMEGGEFRLETRMDSAERDIFSRSNGDPVKTRYSVTAAFLLTL